MIMSTEDKEKNRNSYKDFFNPLGGVVVFVILYIVICFLYLAYSPVNRDIEVTKIHFTPSTWDFIFIVSLLLLCIPLLSLFILSLSPTNICKKLTAHIKNTEEDIKNCRYCVLLYYVLFVVAAGASVWGLFDSPNITLDKISLRITSEHEPMNFKNFIFGLAGIIGLALAGWRSYVAHRQVEVMEERRLDERFIDSAKLLTEALNETNYPTHLGGISGLRDLALTSPEHRQRCLDLICSCNQWMEDYLKEFTDKLIKGRSCYAYWALEDPPSVSWLLEYPPSVSSELIDKEDNRIPRIAKRNDKITLYHEKRSQYALKAISDILKEVSKKEPLGLAELKFYHKMLCGINLSGAELNNINLNNAYLIGADLSGAHMRGAELHRARMRGANLKSAQMQGANLYKAKMQGADLTEANMQGADLTKAQMQKAKLTKANMQGAILLSPNLDSSTTLEGINVDNILFHKGSEADNEESDGLQKKIEDDKANILEKNKDGKFSIKSEKIEELKECYKDIVPDFSKDNPKEERKKFIELIIENREKGLKSNNTDYVKVYKDVKKIWEKLLKKEGSKK